MVETFLALHDKQILKENDWGMILQPIFRPSTIGIVKDDASPPHPIELINRFVDKKS